jgi:hypothetical protein
MHPLLIDAVVAARQDELRRSARHSGSGRRGSPTRARTQSTPTGTPPGSNGTHAHQLEDR